MPYFKTLKRRMAKRNSSPSSKLAFDVPANRDQIHLDIDAERYSKMIDGIVSEIAVIPAAGHPLRQAENNWFERTPTLNQQNQVMK
jgi:hypothetical protein